MLDRCDLLILSFCQIMNGETSRADSPLCGWWLRVCSHMIATQVTPKTGIKRQRGDLANSASTLGESASRAQIQTIVGARRETCCVSVTRGVRPLPVETCYVAPCLSSSRWGHFRPALLSANPSLLLTWIPNNVFWRNPREENMDLKTQRREKTNLVNATRSILSFHVKKKVIQRLIKCPGSAFVQITGSSQGSWLCVGV